jgi:hypothetical protein
VTKYLGPKTDPENLATQNDLGGGGTFIINTDDDPGSTIYVGSVDPDTLYTLAAGDVWIEVPAP